MRIYSANHPINQAPKVYNEVAEALRHKDLGQTFDGRNVSDVMFMFMEGARQALINILSDGKALNYALQHVDDSDHDYWEEGHYSVIRHYKIQKGL